MLLAELILDVCCEDRLVRIGANTFIFFCAALKTSKIEHWKFHTDGLAKVCVVLLLVVDSFALKFLSTCNKTSG